MRHRVYGQHLGRDKNQRAALIKGLIRSLFLHESITTTEAKIKAIKGVVDRLITKAKQGNNSSKNYILSLVPDEEVRKKLISEIASRYSERTSGFATTVRLGARSGDGAMMVRMSLIEGDKRKVSLGKETRGISKRKEKKAEKEK